MFFKTSGYKPRSGSASSQTSSGSAIKDDSKSNTAASETSGPAASAGAAGRRRSSAGADKFAGLEAMKRGSSGDQGQRKASWAEQKPGQPGILGGMWHSFTKGSN